MTVRRVLTGITGALLAAGVWIYVENLRYERSFYRRWLLEQGRYDMTEWWRTATEKELELIRQYREEGVA